MVRDGVTRKSSHTRILTESDVAIAMTVGQSVPYECHSAECDFISRFPCVCFSLVQLLIAWTMVLTDSVFFFLSTVSYIVVWVAS